MPSVSTVLGFIPLIVSNLINYQISHRVIHPLLQKYLLSTNSNSVTKNLNKNLKKLSIEYQVKQTEISPLSQLLKPSANITANGDKKQRLVDLSVRFLFDLSMSFSLQIVSLVLFEIIGFGNEVSISLYWSFTLFVLIILLSYLIPSLLIFDFIVLNIPILKNKTVSSYKAYFSTFGVVLVCWIIFSQLMDIRLEEKLGLTSTTASDGTTPGLSFVQGSLIELSMIGISCLAFLNGLGCVTQLFNTYFKKPKTVKLQEIKKITDSLKTTENLIDLRQQESSSTTNRHTRSKSDFSIQDEIKALIQMKNDLIDELTNLVSNYRLQQSSKSVNGLFKKIYDYLFGLFCLYKIISISIIKLPYILYKGYNDDNQTTTTTSTHGDPLATTLANLAVKVFGDNYYDVDKLSINITLALSLCLFLLSFNSVKMTMDKFSKVTKHSTSHDITAKPVSTTSTVTTNTTASKAHKSYLIELLISELSGIYIISTTLMLNSNTLPHHLAKFDEVGIDKIANEIVENWYTKWFALSCLMSMVGLLIIEHVEKMYGEFEFDDDEDIYDEEMMVGGGKLA